MRLKLDENLDARLALPLREAGHNVATVPEERSPGLVVLRGPDDRFPTLRLLVRTLIGALAKGEPSGRLWIIEPGRVRIHEAPAEAEE